jgi:hypothetical protein
VLPEAVEQGEESTSDERLAAPGRRELTFGFLGRIAPWNEQHVFLEAFAEAFADRPEVRGLVV